jgi:hypothetical protein
MSTIDEAARLRAELTITERSLERIKDGLKRIEATCVHNRDGSAWGPVRQGSETYKEEVVDVHAPMLGSGVDRWHASRYVDASRTIWTRTCKHCGKVEKTTQTKDRVTQVPAF